MLMATPCSPVGHRHSHKISVSDKNHSEAKFCLSVDENFHCATHKTPFGEYFYPFLTNM